MAPIEQLRLPIIQDEDLFEDFCRDLWATIWNDADAQRNGRKGQAQRGVDVFGVPHGQDQDEGVQAKAYKEPLTDRQIQDEVDEAKKFVPPLRKLIIATTAPRHAPSQEYVRKINRKHFASKLFRVEILGWEDIRRLVGQYWVNDHPQLVEHYFSISTDAATVRSAVEASEGRVLDAMEQQIVRQEVLTGKVDALPAMLSSEHYHQDMNHVRDLINSGKPEEALPYVRDFRERFWHSADDAVRYRVLHYTAMAQLGLGQNGEAAEGLIGALRLKPEDDTALAFAALSYLIQDNRTAATDHARRALALNPGNATAMALCLQSAPDEEPFEELLALVPDQHRTNVEVANALARCAWKRGDLNMAEQWIRTAIRHDTDDWSQLRGELGDMLIERALGDAFNILYVQVTPKTKALLEEAIASYSAAFASPRSSRMPEERASWFANRALARQVLGHSGADQDLAEATRLLPDDAGLLHRRAMLAIERSDLETAVELLRRASAHHDRPHDVLALASVLDNMDRRDESRDVLQGLLDAQPADDVAKDARSLLLGVYLEEGDEEAGLRLVSEMRQRWPQDADVLAAASEVEQARNDRPEAVTLLLAAGEAVGPETPRRTLHRIAAAWRSLREYGQATKWYERLADRDADSGHTRALLDCHYRAGDLGQALALAERLLSLYGPRVPYSEIAAAIYEEVGDLPSARRIADAYLATNSADVSMRLRRALIALRAEDNITIDTFLDAPLDLNALSLEDTLHVARLYAFRNRSERALEIAYTMRRQHFGVSRAHQFYFSLFFNIDQSQAEGDWLRHERVGVGTAVRVRDEAGEEAWYLIDTQTDPQRLPQELPPSHPLARKLLNTSVGDRIVLVESPYSRQEGTIVEIQSRYVRAVQESITTFEKLFPGVPGMWGVRLGLREGAEPSEDDLQPFFDVLDNQHEQMLTAERMYRESALPIGVYATLTGGHPIEAWGRLMARKNVGVRCASGNPQELNAAMQRLAVPAVLVLDAITLYGFYSLDCRDKIIAAGLRLGITQTTLDLVDQLYEERKNGQNRGLMTVGKEGDQYIRQELTPEDMRRNVAFLEGMLNWIKAHCAILPVRAALLVERPRRVRLEEYMDRSFVDTMLLATEPGHLLYSDDERLRALAMGEFQAEGVWTQPLLAQAAALGTITEQEYANEVVRLASSYYYHTYINGQALVEAARKAEWRPNHPYTTLAGMLSGERCDENSAVFVAVEAMYGMCKERLVDYQLSLLIPTLLDALTSARNRRVTLSKLVDQVRKKFMFLPFQERDVLSTIAAWQRTHIL